MVFTSILATPTQRQGPRLCVHFEKRGELLTVASANSSPRFWFVVEHGVWAVRQLSQNSGQVKGTYALWKKGGHTGAEEMAGRPPNLKRIDSMLSPRHTPPQSGTPRSLATPRSGAQRTNSMNVARPPTLGRSSSFRRSGTLPLQHSPRVRSPRAHHHDDDHERPADATTSQFKVLQKGAFLALVCMRGLPAA